MLGNRLCMWDTSGTWFCWANTNPADIRHLWYWRSTVWLIKISVVWAIGPIYLLFLACNIISKFIDGNCSRCWFQRDKLAADWFLVACINRHYHYYNICDFCIYGLGRLQNVVLDCMFSPSKTLYGPTPIRDGTATNLKTLYQNPHVNVDVNISDNATIKR